MKEIYEMHGRGRSARAIARDLGLARNTVLRYLNSPEEMVPKPRPPRGSKLDPYTEYIDRRLAEGLENCVVLLRELRALGYQGSYTILVEYVRPRRRGRQPEATMRFETAPGEQAQVDWGSLPYIGEDGKRRRVWVFVMTMGCQNFLQGVLCSGDFLGEPIDHQRRGEHGGAYGQHGQDDLVEMLLGGRELSFRFR